MINRLILLSINLSAIAYLPKASLAQIPLLPQPSTAPLEISLLQPNVTDDGVVTAYPVECDRLSVVTANTICQHQLTIPSLWWANEQFGNNLVDNWIAYAPNTIIPGRIDLLINRQNWSLLDYLQRYEIVNHFGTVARDFGYNLRVFNYQKELLATYTCDFSTTLDSCNIANLNLTGKTGIGAFQQQIGE